MGTFHMKTLGLIFRAKQIRDKHSCAIEHCVLPLHRKTLAEMHPINTSID